MYKRVLVALDGSKLGEETLPYARELAGRLDVDLHLLHVFSPFESQVSSLSAMSQFYIDKTAESIREQIREIRAAKAGKQSARSVRVVARVVVGLPAEEITKYAEENDIDLILMATHGDSSVNRWAMGSVAYQVLHTSRIPVLLVRSGIPQKTEYDKWPEQTILVPLDGSELAGLALPHAEALAKQRGAGNVSILLLSVYAPSRDRANYYFPASYPTTLPPNYWDYVQQEIDEARANCEAYLQKIASRLSSHEITVKTECVMGEAAEEIVKYANEHPFRLIVMASHGRSGIRHLAFGSIAEKVLLEANVPILLVSPGLKST